MRRVTDDDDRRQTTTDDNKRQRPLLVWPTYTTRDVTRLARRVLPLVSYATYAPRYRRRRQTTTDASDRY